MCNALPSASVKVKLNTAREKKKRKMLNLANREMISYAPNGICVACCMEKVPAQYIPKMSMF